VESLPCSRTRDDRAEPLCVAQHGAHFVLDEPSQFLGCVVRALQPAPRAVVPGSSFGIPHCSTPGRVHSPACTPLLLSQPIFNAPGRHPVWNKPPGCSNGYCPPPPHSLGWLQLRREVRVSTRSFL
jgi:hypothetical protein